MNVLSVLKTGLCCLILLWPFLLPAQTKKVAVLRGSDVLATVEGQNITRRELTYYWLQVDRTLAAKLGDALATRWKADRGAAAQYTLSDADIYRTLYQNNSDYKTTLDSLITIRLVEILAAKNHFVVTTAETKAKAHELFEAFRKQTNSTLSDDDVMTKFQVPRDIFLRDMAFRLQTERLLAREFARRNGHALNADDWIEVRALFAAAEDLGDAAETEKQYAAAKKRIETWRGEIEKGAAFEAVARQQNEDNSRDSGGLHGLALRGTGTPDNILFTLKPGTISEPIRVKNGWFVFTAGRRGRTISEVERAAAWKAIVESQSGPFLETLRKSARITLAP